MRNSSKSFAHQYGISQKNLSSNASNGLGLNPNLNIEDEYIQNLLKQTHFLNMEIKLIKQKQKQNKGMGIMGILNKDQNPVVSHAISSNAKYSDMKNKLASKVNTAQVNYIKLDDQNFAVKAQRDFVEKASLKQEQNNIQNKLYVDKQLLQNIDRLKDNQKRLKQIRQQNSRVNDTFERTQRQWTDLTNKENTKKLMKQINGNLDQKVQILKQKHFQTKLAILEIHQKKLKQDDQKNRSDPQYIALVEANDKLQLDLKSSQKQLFQMNFKVKQMQELKKLSIRNKDFQAEQKKQAIQDAQKLKKKLADRKTELQVKIKQAKNGLESNDQIRLLKGKVARKDKQISDLRKKTEISENNYKKLRDQVQRLTLISVDKKAINENKQNTVNKLTVEKNSTTTQLGRDQLDYEKLQGERVAVQASLKQARKRLQGLLQEQTYLKAKQEYLTKEINVDEGMKSVKIEQLTGLMHNNSGLNDTIKDVMDKWEQIKRFSRQPPQ